MSSKKRRAPKRLPAIVPRFIKNAVAIGAIPALPVLAGCHPRPHPVVANYQRSAPVVAYFAPPTPVDAAEAPKVQPVVAMMIPSPVVAAVVPHPPSPSPSDAGVDAPAAKPAKKPVKAAKPPPPPPRPDIYGVAAMFAPDPREQLVPEQDLGPARRTKKP